MFLIFILVCALTSASATKNWDYSLIGIETDIRVDYLTTNLRSERIKRGEYGIDGSFTLDKDLGPNNMFEAKTYRSPRGNDDFKPMPFIMQKQSFDDFFNKVYKDVMMEDLHQCANTPYFEDKWEGVFKAGTYEFKLCKFNVGNWPDNMMPGVYKIVMEFSDEEDNTIAVLTVTAEIETTGGMGK